MRALPTSALRLEPMRPQPANLQALRHTWPRNCSEVSPRVFKATCTRSDWFCTNYTRASVLGTVEVCRNGEGSTRLTIRQRRHLALRIWIPAWNASSCDVLRKVPPRARVRLCKLRPHCRAAILWPPLSLPAKHHRQKWLRLPEKKARSAQPKPGPC